MTVQQTSCFHDKVVRTANLPEFKNIALVFYYLILQIRLNSRLKTIQIKTKYYLPGRQYIHFERNKHRLYLLLMRYDLY